MITSPLLTHKGIAHGFFTREGGVSSGLFATLNCGLGSGDDPALVRQNRARVVATLKATDLVTAFQVHSADVAVVERPWTADERPRVDGLVTTLPGLALGVLTADCGPLLFSDARAQVIGAAHAGWKGALTGVGEATIAAMEKLGAHREDILAVLGPTISARNYEVSADFSKPFLAQDADNERFFTPSVRPGHFMFDLPAYLMARLGAAGVGRVSNLDLCTYQHERWFYSFRRATHRHEADYGRQVSAIALVP